MAADLHSLATVTSLRIREFDPAVAVLVIVTVDDRGQPLTGLFLEGKGLAGGNQPNISPSCTGFGVRVVV